MTEYKIDEMVSCDGFYAAAAAAQTMNGIYAVPTTAHPEGTVVLPKGKTLKYDGNGNVMIVDDPDWITGDGLFRKHRKRVTDRLPKAKRKKTKKTHRKK